MREKSDANTQLPLKQQNGNDNFFFCFFFLRYTFDVKVFFFFVIFFSSQIYTLPNEKEKNPNILNFLHYTSSNLLDVKHTFYLFFTKQKILLQTLTTILS